MPIDPNRNPSKIRILISANPSRQSTTPSQEPRTANAPIDCERSRNSATGNTCLRGRRKDVRITFCAECHRFATSNEHKNVPICMTYRTSDILKAIRFVLTPSQEVMDRLASETKDLDAEKENLDKKLHYLETTYKNSMDNLEKIMGSGRLSWAADYHQGVDEIRQLQKIKCDTASTFVCLFQLSKPVCEVKTASHSQGQYLKGIGVDCCQKAIKESVGRCRIAELCSLT